MNDEQLRAALKLKEDINSIQHRLDIARQNAHPSSAKPIILGSTRVLEQAEDPALYSTITTELIRHLGTQLADLKRKFAAM